MKKILKIVVVGFYALLALTAVFFALPQTGWRALSVQTGSMTPVIPKGSLVIIHRQPLGSIAVGQVVTYRDPARPSVTITHRVVAKGERGGIPVFTTKGDANKVADPQIPGGSIVGVVQYHAAGVGKVVNWLRTPLGVILVVGIPGLLVIISEFQLMIRRLQDYAKQEAAEQAQRVARLQSQLLRQQDPTISPGSRPAPPKRPSRPIMRALIALLILPALLFGVKSTFAQLSSSVTLTNNRLGVAATTTTGGGANSTCPAGTSTNSITNTGPGSTNTITNSTTCTITSSNNTSVVVTNNSSQTATSGSVSSSGNTTSGNLTSGSVGTTTNSTTTVNVSN